MRKRLIVAAVLAVVATALTGCTGIPFNGGVSKGVPVQDDTNADIQFLPAGPVQDAAPEQILRGFVEASTSPTGDWMTARQYLSTEFARVWNPSDAVVVDGGVRSIDYHTATSYSLSTEVRATVDSHGNYQALAEPTSTKYAFTFTKASGQWRIASGPNGVILDAATFPRVFQESPLYFFAPGFNDVIPDVRWFPAHASTTTRVVKALLQGPSPWLAATGVALTAVPSGATLVADSVPVEAGVASVNFDSKSFTQGDFTAKRMLRQISSSLAGLGDVTSIDLYFSGAPQGHAAVPAAQQLVSPKSSGQPVVLTGKTFGVLSRGSVSTIPGISSQITALAAQSVGLSADRDVAAVATGSSIIAVRPDKKPVLIDSRPGLLPAVVDANSLIWTVPADAPRGIRISDAGGTSRTLDAPWTTARSLSFLSLSPDGNKLLAGYVTASGSQVCAASIAHGDDRWPRSIGPCLRVLPPAGRVISGAWIDASRVAMLAVGTTTTLRMSTVGGMFVDFTPPVGAKIVTGSGSSMAPRVLTSSGDLYELSSSPRWSLVQSKVSLLASTQ